MEKNVKTPKWKKEEGDDNALKRELEEALQREMNKAPDYIDIKKVNSIVELLEQMDPKTASENIISDVKFAERYLRSEGVSIKSTINVDQNRDAARKWKWVACFAALLVMSIGGNYISVKATNKGIFTNIKECAYIIYFDVFGKSSYEKEDLEKTDIEQIEIDIQKLEVESWEEAQDETGIKFAFPHFIPEDLCNQEIFIQKQGEDNIGISGQYYNDTYSVRIIIRTMGGIGVLSSMREGREDLLGQVQWGNYDIYLYKIDDAIQAIFQDAKCIYTVETNYGQETLKKVVLEMR